ncbi:MAG: hypothetical protein HY292_17450 [Planctomycetes bacterium]|nr:hypothetical protein [Planctomycetota bacterium]
MKLVPGHLLACLLVSGAAGDKSAPAFDTAAAAAETALSAKDFDEARRQIERALERDQKAPRAWELRARWAEAIADRDDLVYSLYKELRLLVAQRAPKAELDALRKRLESLDPIAADLFKMKETFVKKLLPIADRYQQEGRPHSAIRVHQQILALDPERRESEDAIQKISAAPDPSLAETAKPKDLLADVSLEWIRVHDAKHKEWKERAKLVRDNYVTNTDAGYEVLVRSAEAMEQMNAFYRIFFHYGTPEDRKSVPRIELEIFKNRDEYLKLGKGPPVEWSGGQFTGGSVETYIGPGGIEEMTGTLFHEAAHQFVGLATNAAGWLNEGLASFFEGCRILSNGTVLMNLPANHRLFPLVDRMSKGWMVDATDGIDPKDPSKSEPARAPTFRIVLENKYAWGPPWYAPTWGVVYFLYDYQDPVDGRFVYRSAFRDFINSSGGKTGDGAVDNFEKVVLAHPEKPTPGVDFASAPNHVKLPKTVAEVDEVWKEWMTQLRDEQAGKIAVTKPYLQWARDAIVRKDWDDATEHFEKGLVRMPNDVGLLVEFADHLASRGKNTDRATKLVLAALHLVETAPKVDEAKVKALEHRLAAWDPKRESLDRIHAELTAAAKAIVERYLAADLPLMTMEISGHLGTDLRVPGMFAYYEQAARKSGKSLAIWKLAYDERDLDGWAASGNEVFFPYGDVLRAKLGKYEENKWDYQFLTLDTVTSGDFSVEAEVQAERGKNAFCGLVFGRKGAQTFHALVFFPGSADSPETGYLDLASFFEASTFKVWRHNPVDTSKADWHTLRIDVSGTFVDVWYDKQYLTTEEFASLDVLRGSFGLIMGPGESQFRNVRYLARDARDPAASIERKIRMEALEKTASPKQDGTWVGRTPPFPEAVEWAQAPRTSWGEKGAVPTVFVIWSIRQNDLIPIHEWLAALKTKYADVGLEIVSVCEPSDDSKLKDYLASHPFPGSVAVDSFGEERDSIGVTLEAYAIDRFKLPRVILVGTDGKVVWEGDPGYSKTNPWKPGAESYLDAPLDQMIDKLKLRKAFVWRQTWTKSAVPALREGRFDAALPALLEVRDIPKEACREAAEAHRVLESLDTALAGLDATTRAITAAECEPAFAPLIAWAQAYGKPIDPKKLPVVRSQLGSARGKAWEQVLGVVQKALAAWKPGEEKDAVDALIREVSTYSGYFPKHLALELRNALDANDWADAKRLLEQAPLRPAAWLATEQLRF